MGEDQNKGGAIFWLMLALGIVGVVGFVLVVAGAVR